MDIIQQTTIELQEYAKTHKSILLGFSGGKDSLVLLDLCARSFEEVVCYFLYFIPGLQFLEKRLDYARRRWGVKILYYPHWVLFGALKHGVYCDKANQFGDLKEIKMNMVYQTVMAETGINLLATGAKQSDSRWRKVYFKIAKFQNIIYPIRGWNKYDILSYLKMHDIPIPQSEAGGQSSGADMSPNFLWFLYDNYPDDFKRLEEVFPYVKAIVKRREYYGS
jgi:3'-phosphoadenosine 5'-phosphosulfate sulfotransferase (PAPS reductase)/FAD synthetase